MAEFSGPVRGEAPDGEGRRPFPYRVAVFDLDGTLMRYEGVITDETLSALNRLRASGVRVVLATGRRHEGAAKHAARLGFEVDEPLICYGGAMVRSTSGETLLKNTMDPEDALAVLRWAERRGIMTRILGDGWLISSGNLVEEADVKQVVMSDEIEVVASPADWLAERSLKNGEIPIKVTLVAPPASVEGWLVPLQREFSGRLFVTRSLPHYVEVGGTRGKKSYALARLLDGWGVPPEKVIAFGDGENDIDLLRFVGHGVAVGGISPAVREAADAVTGDVYKDGVATYISKLFSHRA
ncbi:Cof-type HAD-IIB family hydrolase [Rubrobacter indicoceani]|uniref:Cof-type HAD-IIB family hydrolase n=1 Tax=Rubrobacter indicoceani TaxID=2051957 RepID=UPI0013C50235|nr:Cof-type HAD-IIB family hydrolase [Rubrobacter indicoceani]